MRFRVGVFLLLVAVFVGIGCRKVIEPNIDRNQPPETWITAAPLDTLGGRGEDAVPGTIPFRFHLYWAGSDPDGEVVGFFYAVTETTAFGLPGEGRPPQPSPKPQDYRFTPKTDSTFIFNVVEGRPDREHAFFLYAVDNEGKVDASPARFLFNANDKSPPIPKFLVAEARGRIFTIGPGGAVDSIPFVRGPSYDQTPSPKAGRRESLDDQLSSATLPRDTVPSGSAFTFEFTALPQAFGTYVVGFRYKFIEVAFRDTTIDPSVQSVRVDYPAHATPAGTHVLTVRALDQANGSTDSTRRVVVNCSADTWFSGPDTLCVTNLSTGWERRSSPNPFYYRVVTGANRFPGSDPFGLPDFEVPCSYLGPANNAADPANWVNHLYADRPVMKSFVEWWEDTLYVRAEGDTVHKNSIVYFLNGGLDRDSPHLPLLPSTSSGSVPDGPNLRRGPANGSPVGFSGRVLVVKDPSGLLRPAESLTYPDYRIGTPFYRPLHALRELARFSGKGYSRLRSVDGDGDKDPRIPDPIALADQVDANPGAATPYQRDLRTKVMTFYINQNAFLLSQIADFSPKAGQTFTSSPVNFKIYADDPDPALIGENTEPGRKGLNKPIRRSVTLRGDSAGVAVSRPDPRPLSLRFSEPTILNIPSGWSPGTIIADIEVCDCQFCEGNPGEGRCTTYPIPFNWQPPGANRPERAW
jgi:hypothetical protein